MGVDESAYENEKSELGNMFESVRYDKEMQALDVCGARELSDRPKELSNILDKLASLLSDGGKGHIMMRCEGLTEICYFRRNMWKLVGIDLPPDPFEGIHHVE
jgi:hypothetical protein